MKKLAIFDFDGTLFDSVSDVLICFNKALAVHGFPEMTRGDLIPCLGGNIDQITTLVLRDNYTPRNLEMLKETYLNFYNNSDKENTLPFAGAHEILKKLQDKGVLLAVNSNRLNYSLVEFIGKFFDDIDFIAIEGQNSCDPPKPDAFGANRILEKSGVDVSEAVYIGDSITDIRTARNAGMDCVLVSWGYVVKKDLENTDIFKTVDEFDELLEIF